MSKIMGSFPTIAMGWLVLLLMVLSLMACAPWKPAPQKLGMATWAVEIPEGWMRLRTPDYEMLSKDGPYLHYVLIQERLVGQAFHFTHRKLDPFMLPHEAAQVVVDNLSADPKIRNFRLHTNAPASMDQNMGFRLVYSYTDTQGVEVQAVYYGAIIDQRFFSLRYAAAKRHYFAKYLDTFEQIHRSLRLALTS